VGGPGPADGCRAGEQVIQTVTRPGAEQGEDPPAHRRRAWPRSPRLGSVSSGPSPHTSESAALPGKELAARRYRGRLPRVQRPPASGRATRPSARQPTGHLAGTTRARQPVPRPRSTRPTRHRRPGAGSARRGRPCRRSPGGSLYSRALPQPAVLTDTRPPSPESANELAAAKPFAHSQVDSAGSILDQLTPAANGTGSRSETVHIAVRFGSRISGPMPRRNTPSWTSGMSATTKPL
jgi:hypothetical protein